jgi:hypothetical protein
VNRSDPKQPLSAKAYLVVALVGLLFAGVFTLVYIYLLPKIIQYGIQGQIYYVVLIPWALSCTAFLFGAMNGVALFTYKDDEIFLGARGAAVLFCLVLIGGFELVPPPPETFDLAVRAHSSESPLITAGQVTLDLPGDPKANIGPDGEANFKGLSAKLRGNAIKVLPKIDGYEEKWLTPSVDGNVLTVELQRVNPTFVQKAALVPPPPKGKSVEIRVDGQRIDAVLDENGEFTFTASWNAGDRVLVEVFVNHVLVASEYQELRSRPIQNPWNLPSQKAGR